MKRCPWGCPAVLHVSPSLSLQTEYANKARVYWVQCGDLPEKVPDHMTQAEPFADEAQAVQKWETMTAWEHLAQLMAQHLRQTYGAQRDTASEERLMQLYYLIPK